MGQMGDTESEWASSKVVHQNRCEYRIQSGNIFEIHITDNNHQNRCEYRVQSGNILEIHLTDNNHQNM